MRLARELDERMLKLQRQGRLGTFPPNTGPRGGQHRRSAMAMGPKDWFVGAFRETGGRLVRGEPLTSPLYYYNGWEEGNILPDPRAAHHARSASSIGCQIPHAVGIAYASRYQGEDAATVCFIGDGGTSEGDFHEALNFAGGLEGAGRLHLPEQPVGDLRAARSADRQPRRWRRRRVAFGMPGLQVDGNDVLAMYVAISEALDRARAGEGPT